MSPIPITDPIQTTTLKRLHSPEPNADVRPNPADVTPGAPKKRKVEIFPIKQNSERPAPRKLFLDGETKENNETETTDKETAEVIVEIEFIPFTHAQRAVVTLLIICRMESTELTDEDQSNLRKLLRNIDNDNNNYSKTADMKTRYPFPSKFIKQLNGIRRLAGHVELIDTAANLDNLKLLVGNYENGKYVDCFFQDLEKCMK